MASIIAAIIAVAKAVPALSSLLSTLMTEWQNYQISQIEDRFEQRKKTRAFLIYQLSNARTDNERIAAFRLISSFE